MMNMSGSHTLFGSKSGDVLLGEDWVSPEGVEAVVHEGRGKRGLLALKNSHLARKIIMFNLLAQAVLVAGVLFLNPFHDGFVAQRQQSFTTEAQLLADVIAASPMLQTQQGLEGDASLDVSLTPGSDAFLYDLQGGLIAHIGGATTSSEALQDRQNLPADALEKALKGETVVKRGMGQSGGALFTAVTPVEKSGTVTGVIGLVSAEGEIEALVKEERFQILRMVVLALVVSIGLSLVLASTIANPIADLAAAAEIGHDRDARKLQAGRIRIPDLTARPDEIGRLSVAMRGMVEALYDRIDSNEQFAADVAHEIKNPLASLRSAVASMHVAKRDDQRSRLLEVIDHDVRRLDRLVSDISNASRLDSELVKEQEEEFNLTTTIRNICDYLGAQAAERGVELITDFPSEPIVTSGLEARLAQVFVNLISNAISFCEEGDAVRVWARKRANRILIVVEDTGPGIPEQALTKIFKRFYSERPQGQFGNNSGLGLSISKQIVEAHAGVIWAENIRPTDADLTSDPLGARFVIGLPG